MANRDVLVIGASAGGVEALIFLARNFPRDLPAAVVVTVHLPPQGGSVLDELLNRAGPLTAVFAAEHDRLRKGFIYIAPADRHLILEGDFFTLGQGPRENNSRPAIDPMMRSAALCCGSRAIGVVLTGTLSDGASGLWAVDQCGGMTVVQDPDDADFPDMPANALNRLRPDHVVKLKEMPQLLMSLVKQPAGEVMPVPPSIGFEVAIARGGHAAIEQMDRVGKRSGFACPDCHGAMWEIDEGDLVRYRCHVGHTYTADLMALALDENLRRALASALRAMEERRSLAGKLQEQAERKGQMHLASSWARRSLEFQRELDTIRGAVTRLEEITSRQEGRRAAE
jgi:two-component system chemotaxis response regulator CheB